MREILFRGKRKDNSEWVYGWLGHLHCHNPQAKTIDSIYFTEITEDHNDRMNIIVDYNTVGQFTGLTDKNGNKIFEGDIIKSESRGHKAISVVKYGKCKPKMFYELLKRYLGIKPKENICGMFATTLQGEDVLLTDCSKIIEIIGNIHDNPELLKGENRCEID